MHTDGRNSKADDEGYPLIGSMPFGEALIWLTSPPENVEETCHVSIGSSVFSRQSYTSTFTVR